MAQKNHPEPYPVQACAAVSGCWQLMPGQAISLVPREAGVLRIARGRVWAIVDGPHTGHGNESGDHFMQAGQVLAARSGQRLVFESWDQADPSPVYFDWTPTSRAVELPVPVTNWQVAVAQPAQDLRHAMLLAAQALGQLLRGLGSVFYIGFGCRVLHQAPKQPRAQRGIGQCKPAN